MSKVQRALALAICLAVSQRLPGQTNDSARPDTPEARAFFTQLQQRFRANDRRDIANLVEYPLLTTLHGRKTRIRNRTNLLSHFDEIFDTGIRCALLGSTDQDVWGNSHGFTIQYDGNIGRIWFDGFLGPNQSTYQYRLMTVNNGPLNKCVKR
jgi:hypothetical protein